MTEDDIKRLIEADSKMMEALRIYASLTLPDSWIGAGFVRSKVWDYLHGYAKSTELPDVDAIYFDAKDSSSARDLRIEQTLAEKHPHVRWSVKNQARMHLFHDDKPYKNSREALSRWVETATCIAARVNTLGKVEILAPYGIDDLSGLILRPTPYYKDNPETFFKRVKDKRWLEKWPKLVIKI